MLKNDLFTITDLRREENIIKANIGLNAAHPIFGGHFPGQPVLPGVCMMQMVKEVAGDHLNKKIKLVSATDLKFLVAVLPDQINSIQMELKINLEGENINVDAKLLDKEQVLFKFKGVFVNR